MARITYIEPNGARHEVEVDNGWTVMEVAVRNAIPGIVAECGGNCACGTCRVYVAEEWQAIVGVASDLEEATLETRDDPEPGKRLACQITVTDKLDGLRVRTPESQY